MHHRLGDSSQVIMGIENNNLDKMLLMLFRLYEANPTFVDFTR